MATLSLDGVGKTYRGGVEAVRDVSLHVRDGEFVSLVGPSGCGKSTLLNVIAGLESLSTGTVRMDGKVVNDCSPRERDVAMVFQSYALYPHLSVAENLAFPLKTQGVPKETRTRRVVETAERLGISSLLDRRPKELSGGQRQRVALGRALVRRPRLFLFDEPLSNLDAALRIHMRAELKRLHQELGTTFLYVTHDQAEAMTLSDRVAVMNLGRLEQVGTPQALYREPSSLFVATFFGTPRINVVRPETLGLKGPEGWRVAVRPEHVQVGVGTAPEGARTGARLFVLEPMGAECWVTVELGEDRLTARAPGEFFVAPAQPLWVRVDPEALQWFHGPSGARVARSGLAPSG